MGQMAEMFEPVKEKKFKLGKHWKTKDGTIIKIKDMDDLHLINSIKLMVNRAPEIRAKFMEHIYAFSSYMSGEMASEHVDAAVLQMEEMDNIEFLKENSKQFKALCKQAKKRGFNIYNIFEEAKQWSQLK